MEINERFRSGLEALGLTLTEEQFERFDRFYELLIEKNKVMNLTAITEYDDVVTKHFIDSLSIVKSDFFKNVSRETFSVIDIGSGAGFPGIPLKIAFPNMKITYVDSLNKRVNFLNDVIRDLGLKDAIAIHARSEEIARKPEYREKFDLAVSRAVAKLNSLSELSIPFVKKGGCFISYKAGDSDEEIRDAEFAIKTLGGKITEKIGFDLPGSDNSRTLVVISKTLNTPGSYPRSGGKIFDKPLMKKNS